MGDLQRINSMVSVDKQTFLKMIAKLKNADSLSVLRDEALKLKDRFTRMKSSPNGDAVEFDKAVLLGELDQIIESLTLKRARHYIKRMEKRAVEIKTSAVNDINLNRWKEYGDILTDSLWVIDKRDGSGVHRADYWGNFIPQIPNQMMKRYTKRGDWVLDIFAGCGTTLIESRRLGRNAVGVELLPEIAEKARKFVSAESNRHGIVNKIITGDSLTIDYQKALGRLACGSVQLVIMHPPYFDIIKFSNDPKDLSNADSLDEYLKMIRKAAENALSVLDKGRYLVLVIGDKYSKGEWIPLGFLAMNELLKTGLSLKSIIVKNFDETAGKRTQKELWKYRALMGGFYVFKHEYIFLFRKT